MMTSLIPRRVLTLIYVDEQIGARVRRDRDMTATEQDGRWSREPGRRAIRPSAEVKNLDFFKDLKLVRAVDSRRRTPTGYPVRRFLGRRFMKMLRVGRALSMLVL